MALVVEKYWKGIGSGTQALHLAPELEIEHRRLVRKTRELKKRGLVSLNEVKAHKNAMVVSFNSKGVSIAEEDLPSTVVIFPAKSALKWFFERYGKDEGFFLNGLRKGDFHPLETVFFSPDVLDIYKSSPFVSVTAGDVCIKDKFVHRNDANYREELENSKFHIALDFEIQESRSGDSRLAVYIKTLCESRKAVQDYWEHFKVNDVDLSPDFISRNYFGQWGTRASVFSVIKDQVAAIHKMTLPTPIFRDDLSKDAEGWAPITFLSVNSSKHFYEFIDKLEKRVVQSLSKSFFESKVKISPDSFKEKGTLQLLEVWLQEHGIAGEELKRTVGPLKEIRRLRQVPAHEVVADAIDKDYLEWQREITFDLMYALNKIGALLQETTGHTYPIPATYDGCQIVFFP